MQNGGSGGIDPVIDEIEAEHRAWKALVKGLDPRDEATTPEGWSVAEALAHVASWKENALRIARLQAQPGAPELDPGARPSQILGIDVDEFNAEFFAAPEPWTLRRALAWSERIHADLIEALSTLSRDRVLRGSLHGAPLWLVRPSVIHSREHRTGLEARMNRRAGAG